MTRVNLRLAVGTSHLKRCFNYSWWPLGQISYIRYSSFGIIMSDPCASCVAVSCWLQECSMGYYWTLIALLAVEEKQVQAVMCWCKRPKIWVSEGLMWTWSEECYVTKLSLRWGNGELNGRKDETELLIMMEVYPAGVGTCRLDMAGADTRANSVLVKQL